MLKTVHVELGDRSYRIAIGPGARSHLKSENGLTRDSGEIVVVTDQVVARHWLAALQSVLPRAARVIQIPAGEASKALRSVEAIAEQLAQWRVDRNGVIVALGGGVVGDLAGFVASVWNRGVRFYQVPTTLLAAIDASVGGKTGVNTRAGKNLIGTFHQPQLVVVDTDFLATLPEREYIAGLSESIKHAAIRDPELFDWHAANAAAIRARDSRLLPELVARNCAIKADVVSRDERESGLRAILNYGHTIGHAIEALFEYELLHGECVALGMLAENHIAVARGLLDRATADRIRSLIAALGLPTRLPKPIAPDAAWRYCLVDKKNQAGGVHAVLLRNVGDPVRVGDVASSEAASAVADIQP